jgi:MerR family transcriptional regulator/heat shock protein HspR
VTVADTGSPTPPQRHQRAVYVISVAAELAGVHPQTLRIYERKGLLEPARTVGGSRRYSDDDIRLLQRIHDLTEDGLNLAGVKRVLELEQRLAETEAALAQSRRDASAAVDETHRTYRRDLVPVRQAVVRYGETSDVLRHLLGD